MKITVGVSNRHVHLTKEDFFTLFGNYDMEKLKDLVQVGEFASTSKLTIKTEKSEIDNVRVLGPFRGYTQVEISKTDAYKLGLNPPVRNSGDLEGASEITIVGPNGEVTKKCCIIATRHIHINKEDREKLGLTNKEYVSVRVGSEKAAVLENVFIKESPNGVLEFHIDTDDANANLVKSGEIAEVIF